MKIENRLTATSPERFLDGVWPTTGTLTGIPLYPRIRQDVTGLDNCQILFRRESTELVNLSVVYSVNKSTTATITNDEKGQVDKISFGSTVYTQNNMITHEVY